MRKVKIGISLGSGGAKGLSHIGILKVLERENIEISYISGSSIGALVGGLYAFGYSANDLEKIALNFSKENFYDLFDFSKSFQGIIKGDKILNLIDELLKGASFSDLKIPFLPVAVDLITGDKIIIKEGKVSFAIRASISIPVIFQPFPWKDKLLIDGGVLSPVPVKELKEEYKPDIIIAVNLHKKIKWNFKEKQKPLEIPIIPSSIPEKITYIISQSSLFREFQRRLNPLLNPSLFEVLMQTIDIMNYEIAEQNFKEADIVITPEVQNYGTFDFDKAKELIALGEKAGEENILKIKEIIKKKRRRFFIF
jgi:NTE family protein